MVGYPELDMVDRDDTGMDTSWGRPGDDEDEICRGASSGFGGSAFCALSLGDLVVVVEAAAGTT